MIEDLRKRILSIRQDYQRDLDRLIGDLKEGRISGDQYREQASLRRTQCFADDHAAHAEMSERVKRKSEMPEWLSDPPKE